MKSVRINGSCGAVIAVATATMSAATGGATAAYALQAPAAAAPTAETGINLDLRDAPIRDALTQLFRQAHVDYSIANNVQGFVTMKVTYQPLESALRLMLRASGDLTYDTVKGTYFVRRGAVENPSDVATAPAPARLSEPQIADTQWDTVQLNYIDPYDLQRILRLILVPTFSRQSGASRAGAVGGGTAAGIPGAGASGLTAPGTSLLGSAPPVILGN